MPLALTRAVGSGQPEEAPGTTPPIRCPDEEAKRIGPQPASVPSPATPTALRNERRLTGSGCAR